MFADLFRSLRLSKTGRHQPRANPRNRRLRPLLEPLEDRTLLSTLTVTNLSDHDPGSLRDTIAQASPGDAINFNDGLTGTITLTTGPLAINQSLDIEGPGSSVITVSGNAASRVFDLSLGVSVALAGLTIANGKVEAFSSGSDVFVYGAGIYNAGTLNLSDCTITGNLVQADIVNNTGHVLYGNSYGAGLYNSGSATVTRCRFAENVAVFSWSITGTSIVLGDGYGGGIDNVGVLTVTDSTFEHNTGVGYGGGLYNSGMATVFSSTFHNNQCPNGAGGNIAGLTRYSYGGAIANSQGTLTVINSTIFDNTANNGVDSPGGLSVASGGGVYSLGELLMINDTIANNHVSAAGASGASFLARGGGVYVDPSSPHPGHLVNTIVAGDDTNMSGPDVFGPFASLGHNLIGKIDGSTGWIGSDLTGTIAVPLDAGLGTFGDYGGPTQTIPLLGGSPALNAADPVYAPATDQRGFLRGPSPNIGSWEDPPGSPDICSTMRLRVNDLAILLLVKNLGSFEHHGVTESGCDL